MKQDGRLKLRPGVLKGTALVLEKVVGPTTKSSWWKCECQVCKHVSVRAANALNTEPKSCSNCIYEQRTYGKKKLECPTCGDEMYVPNNLTIKYCSKACKMEALRTRDRTGRTVDMKGALKSISHGINSRAKLKKLECDVTPEVLTELLDKQGGLCARTGRVLEVSKGDAYYTHVSNTVSVDRVDSNKGYTVDNIELVTCSYNTAKNTMSTEELQNMCKDILTKAGYIVTASEGSRL